MAKNAVLQMIIEDALQDIMLKTGADNVVVDETTGETLALRLASIATGLAGTTTPAEVDTKISEAISALIGGAPETYDTLKEIADYIAEHEEVVTALNAAIGGKVDKVTGMGLSANDFTDTLLAKLNGIAEGASKVAASTTNGNILVNDVETKVYTHPTNAGNKHIPAGGTVGQVLKNNGDGIAEWGDVAAVIRYGTSTPDDLGVNELFVKIVE